MGSGTRRSIFVAALCAGVAMVGTSVNGLLGVDAELERSVLAAQHRTSDDHSVRVLAPREATWDCPGAAPAPQTHDLS
jgi:hypothetical protein